MAQEDSPMVVDIRGFGTTAATAGEPADRASIRRSNLGMILCRLRDHGPRSRSLLAEETGLPRATVTNLVAELTALGLVREGQAEGVGAVGRPRQAVELDGRHLCGVGVEINADYVSALALDPRGTVLLDRRLAVDVPGLGPDRALDTVATLIGDVLAQVRKRRIRPIGVTVAVPGGGNSTTGQIAVSTSLGWHGVPVVAGLRERLGRTPPLAIANDARLASIAEYVAVAGRGIRDLLYVTGEFGVGGGIVNGGREYRGFRGAGAEFGHMPMNPEPLPCPCGRRGCWETMVGLGALLALAADPGDPVRDPWTDREQRLSEIRHRAEAGDPRTVAALGKVAADLGTGVSLLVDVLDPELVVLGGYFAFLGDHLLEQVQRTIDERAIDPGAGRCTVVPSVHGATSAVRGGAQLALEPLFQNPGRIAA